MMTKHGLLRISLLAIGIFMLASSSGIAKPVHAPADVAIQARLPILLKKFMFGNGTVTGNVINAAVPPGQPGALVSGAQVCWASNCVLSNSDGEYQLDPVGSGHQILTASAEGFVDNDQDVYVIGNTVTNQDIAIIPDIYKSGLQYRVLLTWDPTPCWQEPNGEICWPNDLDFHMWLEPSPLNYHIGYYYHYNPETGTDQYWLDRGDCLGLFPNACLEADETDGYGPETLAIEDLVRDEIYYVGVLNFNQSQPGVPPVSRTGALARLYDLNGLVQTYEVPTNIGDSNFWYIFKIDHTVVPPIITDENCVITYTDNPPECPLK